MADHQPLGRLANPNIKPQFSASRIDALSFMTTPPAIFFGDTQIGHASGFFWRATERVWLITNWHVVTGNNPFTGMALIPGKGAADEDAMPAENAKKNSPFRRGRTTCLASTQSVR